MDPLRKMDALKRMDSLNIVDRPPEIHVALVDTRIEPRQMVEPARFPALLASSVEVALSALASLYESRLSKPSKASQSRIPPNLTAEITSYRDRLKVFLTDQARYPGLLADEVDSDGMELQQLGPKCLVLMDRALDYIRLFDRPRGRAFAIAFKREDAYRELMADLQQFHEMVQSHVSAQEARYVQADCTPDRP